MMPRPTCLVCEDELLIALDVETCLDAIGVGVAGPFASGTDALAWAADNKADVAVLDYKLLDGECMPLISALRKQEVPIVIHSGWLLDEADMPLEIRNLPWVSKPMDCNALLGAMAKVAPSITLSQGMSRPLGGRADGVQPISIKSSGVPLTQVMIRRLKALAPLGEAATQAMAGAVVRTYSVRSGLDIVHAETGRSECHVLLAGMAAPYKLLSDGRRQIVRFAIPGDFIDLDGFVGGTMDHSVSALGSCTLGVIPHEVLFEFMQKHPDLALALWRHTLADAAVFREWVVNVGQRSAKERIAHVICEVFSRLMEVGLAIEISGSRTFSWHLTQQDLGDAIGMSVVHVNRSLQELRARGLIDLNRDNVTIHDWLGLKNLADFKAGYLSVALHGQGAAAHQPK